MGELSQTLLVGAATLALAASSGGAAARVLMTTVADLTSANVAQPADITRLLDGAQRNAISNYVSRCWSRDEDSGLYVVVRVTVDTKGITRHAEIVPEDAVRVQADPRLVGLSVKAIAAALDPNCSVVPLPSHFDSRDAAVTITFRFGG